MNPSATLARHLPIAHLRWAVPGTLESCPTCGSSRLRVFQDQVLRAEWVHCAACGLGGDAIEMLGREWKTTVIETLWRLKSLNVPLPAEAIEPDFVAAYQRDHIEYRERFNHFWAESQAGSCGHVPPTGDLDFRLCLGGLRQAERWIKPPGLVGATTVRQVEALFHPGSVAPRNRKNRDGHESFRAGGGAGQQRVFKGAGWNELLVIPYFDLPGRICGFVFIGRDANLLGGDVVYKRANLGPSALAVKDSGLAFPQALKLPAHRHLGDMLFVLNNPAMALQLHASNLRDSSRLLPVVATWNDDRRRTTGFVEILKGRKLVFWTEYFDHHVVAQAKQAHGSVAIGKGPSFHATPTSDPLHWLYGVQQAAIPWQEALCAELEIRDFEGARKLILQMSFRQDELQEFFWECPPNLQSKLAPLRDDPHFASRVIVGKRVIFEGPGGWVDARTGQEVSNALIRIDQELSRRDGTSIYTGHVTIGTQQAAFRLPTSAVRRRGLGHCLQDVLLSQGLPPLQMAKGLSRRAEMIAVRLHPSRFLSDTDFVGWNDETSRFTFPQFSLGLSTQLRPGPGLPLVDEETPAKQLTAPTKLDRKMLRPVSIDCPDANLFWATFVCLAHNILAPALESPPTGIIIKGAIAADLTFAIAESLGCRSYVVPVLKCRRKVERILQSAGTYHHWPDVVLPGARCSNGFAAWLASAKAKNVVVPLLSWSEFGDWHVIQAAVGAGASNLIRQFAGPLIVGYLADRCRRHLDVDSWRGDALTTTWHDVSLWFGRVGRGKPAVDGAARYFHLPSLKTTDSLAVRSHAPLCQRAVRYKGFAWPRARIAAQVQLHPQAARGA